MYAEIFIGKMYRFVTSIMHCPNHLIFILADQLVVRVSTEVTFLDGLNELPHVDRSSLNVRRFRGHLKYPRDGMAQQEQRHRLTIYCFACYYRIKKSTPVLNCLLFLNRFS